MIRPHRSRHTRLLTLALALLLSISAHSWATTVVAQNGVGSGPPRNVPMSMSNRRTTGINQRPATRSTAHKIINRQIIDKY